MINESLKSFLQSKIDSADKSIPKFVLEELRQKILTSPTRFSKTDIETLFNNLQQRYSEGRENSLLGKVDSLFREISNVEKLLSNDNKKKQEEATQNVTDEAIKSRYPWKAHRKAKLETIGDDVLSLMVALRWLEFLLDNYGPENTADILDYYESIGWISSSVKEQMIKFTKMTGIISPVQEYKVKPTIQDHIVTMLFIEKLNGGEISRDLIEALERDFRMLKKGVDELYGV
ncbi:MAG TPA: FlaD/FlaE family flagellar protein [Thermoplasmataceae archaeon]|nr:flagellar protein E [Thermoplasmatales archaeon AK]HLH86728.1 FlaD/FlaE family flagellar protein [Thermoplasmataceae archaeon]